MPTNKLQRINEDIQRTLSALLREVKDLRVQQGMLSIVAVETTPDLKFCKVYLSVLGLEDEKGLNQGLKSASGYLRRALGQALSLRHTPELIFKVDKSMEYGARMSKLLQDLGTVELSEEALDAGDDEADE
ncbi:MAG: 30S ribosome-binding factor RbfA [Oscillospiraceae bacterium]|nr:30S ribosome-binding factor RbfA [Oscillospiraceae bacterium]